ncbi:MAG TPA: hypothetical protein PKA90_04055 [Ignavibacteria bacterium]|mgnify:CR=1 FL=1|nr:hypothetical protein [Ignavibacteria bacterium]HMR39583.1 hypothetical protein [Ignavibacteria bacterium]
MQIISLIWGILAILGMLIGFIPCLGAYNWLNIPFAAIGLIISIIAVVNEKPGESKSSGTAGIIMCASAIIFGVFRLMLGGGIL